MCKKVEIDINDITIQEGCTECTQDYRCFDCEYYEMSWNRGYTLNDDMTWEDKR